MRLLRQFLQIPVHIWVQKQLLLRISKLNGTVAVIGQNLHEINKRHSQSKSDRFLALLQQLKNSLLKFS